MAPPQAMPSSHQTAGSDAIEKYDYWIFAATVKNVFFRKGKSAVMILCANKHQF
jgi:hypothetical protein